MSGIDIKFEVNGREIPLDKIEDELTKQIFLKVRDGISDALRSVRCPVHNQAPSITIRGDSIDNLEFNINVNGGKYRS